MDGDELQGEQAYADRQTSPFAKNNEDNGPLPEPVAEIVRTIDGALVNADVTEYDFRRPSSSI